MLIRNAVSISNMDHESKTGLVCVHFQSQEFMAEPGNAALAGRAFCWIEELQKWSSAAFMACVHLEDDFVLEFHFDVNNKIQVLLSNSTYAFTAGLGI